MKRRSAIALRWLIVLTYAGIIFYLSSRSRPIEIGGFLFAAVPHMDKLLHFIEYAILCFLLCRAMDLSLSRPLSPSSAMSGSTLFLCFLLTSLYGLSDEIHQIFVPPRKCDAVDLAVDVAAAAAVVLLWPAVTARLPFLRR